MLEQERGIRKCATLKNQTCVNQPAEGILQYCLAALRDRGQQLIGEVAAYGGADLSYFLGYRTEAVKTSQQRRVQAQRDRE